MLWKRHRFSLRKIKENRHVELDKHAVAQGTNAVIKFMSSAYGALCSSRALTRGILRCFQNATHQRPAFECARMPKSYLAQPGSSIATIRRSYLLNSLLPMALRLVYTTGRMRVCRAGSKYRNAPAFVFVSYYLKYIYHSDNTHSNGRRA